MVRKRRRHEEEVKPWCFYCDREFNDEATLITHQKGKHFKCEICHKRLVTVKALAVHSLQVHKQAVSRVPDSLPDRESTEFDIFGMSGIPVGMTKGGPVPDTTTATDVAVPVPTPPPGPPGMPGVAPPGAPSVPSMGPAGVSQLAPGAPLYPHGTQPYAMGASGHAVPPAPYAHAPRPGYGAYQGPVGPAQARYHATQPPPQQRYGGMQVAPPGYAPGAPPAAWHARGPAPLFPAAAGMPTPGGAPGSNGSAPPMAAPVPAGGAAASSTAAPPAVSGLVWQEEGVSMEERRASLARYCGSAVGHAIASLASENGAATGAAAAPGAEGEPLRPPGPAAQQPPPLPGHTAQQGPPLPGPAAQQAPPLPGPAAQQPPPLPGHTAQQPPPLPGHTAQQAPPLPGPAAQQPAMPRPPVSGGGGFPPPAPGSWPRPGLHYGQPMPGAYGYGYGYAPPHPQGHYAYPRHPYPQPPGPRRS